MSHAYDVRNYNEDSSDNDDDSDNITIDTYGLTGRPSNTIVSPSERYSGYLSELYNNMSQKKNSIGSNTRRQMSLRDKYENVYFKENRTIRLVSDANTQTNSETTNMNESNIDDTNIKRTTRLTIHPLIMENINPDNAILHNTETYELEKFNKNAMVIFNHEHFWTDSSRPGTALDVIALEDTFKQFRFEVETHNDLTRSNLFEVLNQFTSRDYKEYGCICVAILTHGLDDGYLKAADTRYRERDAFATFDCHANPSLVAKPIIFLIQACRGPYTAYPVFQGPEVEFDAASREVRPSESDMIIFHSSFFGKASVRVVSEGTWFIQTVCEQMKRHASSEHLEKLFRRVRRIVALEKEYNEIKQMPVVTTTLLKKLYLKEIKVCNPGVCMLRSWNRDNTDSDPDNTDSDPVKTEPDPDNMDPYQDNNMVPDPDNTNSDPVNTDPDPDNMNPYQDNMVPDPDNMDPDPDNMDLNPNDTDTNPETFTQYGSGFQNLKEILETHSDCRHNDQIVFKEPSSNTYGKLFKGIYKSLRP